MSSHNDFTCNKGSINMDELKMIDLLVSKWNVHLISTPPLHLLKIQPLHAWKNAPSEN